MTEPTTRTKAGRALLAELSESPLPGARYTHSVVALRLAAIEREAVNAERERLRVAVEGLPLTGMGHDTPRASVLALLEPES